MTFELIPMNLTAEQKAQVCGILSVGCDRQTAADYVGCSLADIRLAMQQDMQFLASVRRSEAGAELGHMRNVQEVATSKKEWRASMWWLERRSPERFARRAGAITSRQLKSFVAVVSDALKDEMQSPEDRGRLMARLAAIADSVDQMLRDAQQGSAGSAAALKPLALEAADLRADEASEWDTEE